MAMRFKMISYCKFTFIGISFLFCISAHAPASALTVKYNLSVCKNNKNASFSFLAASNSLNKRNSEPDFTMRQRLDNKRVIAELPFQQFNLPIDFFYIKIRFFTSASYILSLSHCPNYLRGPPSLFI